MKQKNEGGLEGMRLKNQQIMWRSANVLARLYKNEKGGSKCFRYFG